MQPYEEAPPPYPGAHGNQQQPIVISSKGDYKGVPVYEVGPASAPVYGATAYPQPQVPLVTESTNVYQVRHVRVGRHPVQCICPQCHQQIITNMNHDSGVFAWLMCLLLLIVGCIPCCIIPFCATSCQDVTHTCPHCSAVIGHYKVL